MDLIKIEKYIFKKYLSNNEILNRAKLISHDINDKYENKEITLIGVLNGCIPFMNTLMRSINCNYSYDFIKVSSYNKFKSSEISLDLKINKNSIKDKNIFIIEDIIDSGKTLEYIKKYLLSLKPKSLKIISLLVKDKTRHMSDWYGFEIPDQFVIGFGMDYENAYRNLKDIYIIEKNEK